jgi:DNA-binding transcriptional LysR family regulator
MAQPQLSRLVKFIESEVGVPLLVRTTRNISLTPAGKVFLDQSRLLIEQEENALELTRNAAEGLFGSITIGYMDFAISSPLPRILSSFRHKFAEVNIVLDHLWTERQRASLLDHGIDVGFLIGPFEHPDIASIPVNSSQLMVVLPEAHPMAELAEIDLRIIADEPFIFGTASKWRPFREVVDRICVDHGFLPRVVQEAFNSDAIFGLVSAQLGVTIYPERPFEMYPRGVVVRPIANVTERISTIVGWNKRNPSKMLRNFIDVVRRFAVSNKAANEKPGAVSIRMESSEQSALAKVPTT